MKVNKIDHICIAVKDLAAARVQWEKMLGKGPDDEYVDEPEKIRVARYWLGGVGFELFDKPAFGLSDFVQNVNYRRALERELARTIQSLQVVDSARVHLALPPESVFADEKKEASASVVVRLRGGAPLPAQRVSAIAHLVASGVEGLESSRVSVIDGQGRMLTDGNSDDDDSLTANQLEIKAAMEQRIESILLAILEPVVGMGSARARATVELETARTFVLYAAWRSDQGMENTKEAAMAKLYASEAALSVCDKAARVLASYGYAMEYPIQRYLRDIRFTLIGGGTSEILKLIIAKEIGT